MSSSSVSLEPDAGSTSYTVKSGSEVLGYLVIDSTVAGRSCGGLRMAPDVDEAEIAGLARAMTLKFGYLSLPQGGAKAGVRGDPEAPAEVRRRRLAEFGRAIAPYLYAGHYAPFEDLGTDNSDIRRMLEDVGVPVKARELRGKSSGYYTARSVLAGIKQGARHLGLDPATASVAIEGYGKVGGALGDLLAAERAHVVAVSTSRGALYNPRGLDTQRVSALAAAMGSRFVEAYPEADRLESTALSLLPVDILSPCARHHTIHAGNAAQVAAKLVAAGANNPTTAEADQILNQRSVLLLPYFVTNCGGTLGGTMEFSMHDRQSIDHVIDHILGDRIARLLGHASKGNAGLYELAESEALRGFARVRDAASRSSLRGRIFGAGLEMHRRGYVPGGIVRRLSMSYFDNRAGGTAE